MRNKNKKLKEIIWEDENWYYELNEMNEMKKRMRREEEEE